MKTSSRAIADENVTRFLNIDLDIRSNSPLDSLVGAFGRHIVVLHVGKVERGYGARLELAPEAQSPDRLLRRFVKQVQQLPRAGRVVWNSARAREFNIGIQAARNPYSFEFRLESETLRAVAAVKARIGITVYGAVSASRTPS